MGFLSTTTNGLWVLQALTKTESMPIPLRLRPFVPTGADDLTVATDAGIELPITATAEYRSLVEAGAIHADTGQVDDAVADWLAVLSNAGRQVVLSIRQPAPSGDGTVIERTLVVAQQESFLAMAARFGEEVVVGPVGHSDDPAARRKLIGDQLVYALGVGVPARMDGINIRTSELQEALHASYQDDRATMVAVLGRLGLSPEQVDVVVAAVRTEESALAVISVIDLDVSVQVAPETVAVVDTDYGRVCVSYTTAPDHTQWTSIWPGTESAIRADLDKLLGIPVTQC